MRVCAVVLALAVVPDLGALCTFGQQAPGQSAADEVLLDIVARDKKGKPVADLKQDEVTVLDEGAKQKLTGFRLVQGAAAPVRLVTLVFEPPAANATQTARDIKGTSEAEQRKNARTAATELVKGEQGTNVYYSVLAINRRLFAVQPFTNDREAVIAAINRATASLAAGKLVEESDAIKSELRTNAGETADSTKAFLTSVMLAMLRMNAGMAGDDARLSIAALESLVQGLQAAPGRKPIVYFSSGMVLPPELNVPFQNLVGMANRANVAVYAVDTRGVMVEAQNRSAAETLSGAAGASRTTSGAGDQVNAPSRPSFVTREEVMASDDAETSARLNVQLPLRDLAESTGGFLIGDSNDVRGPVRQFNEELDSYYEVTYRPAIQNYDGAFRKTKVEIGRKNVVVRARSGYFALPAELRASGIQVFEAPLLKAISDGKLSQDVEYRAGAVRLGPREDGTDVALLVEVPLHGLQPKTAGGTENVHFSLGAVVKDARGETVEKVTRDRSLKVTAEQLKAGNFLERATISIPPGKYTLESAVMDRETAKIGVQKSEFTIAPKTRGVAISSITGVRTFTPNAKGLGPNEAFQFQGGAIGPTLNTSVARAPDSNLRLFFVVYQDASIAAPATVEIEFLQNGKTLQKAPLPLPPADARGRIPYVMTIPASAIPPGDYEVQATARQGDTAAQAATAVRIEQ